MISRKLALTMKCVNRMIVILLLYFYNINIYADNYIINNVVIKINNKSIKQAKDQALEEGARKALSFIKNNKESKKNDNIKSYFSIIEAYEINSEEINNNYYKANFTFYFSDRSIEFALNDKIQEMVLVPVLKLNDQEIDINKENTWYKLWNEEWLTNNKFYLPNFNDLENINLNKSDIILNNAAAFNNLIKTLKSNCLIIAFADISYSQKEKIYFIRTKLKNFIIIDDILKWQSDSMPIIKSGNNIDDLIKESINLLLKDIDKKEVIINASNEKNE